MIPQSPELQKEILQTELDSVEENLKALNVQGKEISRAMPKGVLMRKENRKDDVVDFKMMGIDHLFVDESHYPNFIKIQTLDGIYQISKGI